MFLKINHFSSLFLWFMLFLVTASCRLLVIISIRFAFSVVSLLWTSRYVLIDISNLTHFLCCNLFVMFCLTPSAISANVLKIRLPITSIYPFTDSQLHHKCPVTVFDSDFPEHSQNSHELPCGTKFL